MRMWRPVGLFELEKIAASSWREFPPRFEGQPIFYPVLTRRYADDIARDWNTDDAASGFCGFVTEFDVDDAFASRYPVQIVGASDVARELWVPAEALPAFNAHVIDRIRVVASFYGPRFEGERDPGTDLPRPIIERFGA